MKSRRFLGVVAGLATLMGALPLATVFAQWTWLIQCIIAVIIIEAAATAARSLRMPAWVSVVAMLAGLLTVLTLLYPSGRELLGLIPTGTTFTHFAELLNQAGVGIREMGIPVGDHEGLLFLTVLGIGSVAICVDVCAVSLRRPALAGLPMLAIYSVPVAVHQDSVAVLPFIIGAAGFLWLLVADNVDRVRRFGRRFTGEGRSVDVWEPSPLAAAGRRLAVIGVLVAVVLPLAVPGMTTGLLDRWGTGGGGPGAGRGTGRTVNLSALLEGTLKQDEETDLVRVTTSEPEPFYLRFGVADDLSMDGFRNRSPVGRSVSIGLPDPRRNPRPGVFYYEGHASVEILDLNIGLLPVYSEPIRLQRLDSSWQYDPRMNVIFSNRSSTLRRSYEFDYVHVKYDPAALRRANPIDESSELRQYLAAPRVAFVDQLVNQLIAGKTNQYDKIRALYDFFSVENGFQYSLVAKADTSGVAIVDFLTNRSGFCVQYAAALAWMARIAGMPARVAFGFANGNKLDGNTRTLTNRNLHAWTEVYFDGFGWVPFDATPVSAISGAVRSDWAPNVDAPEGSEQTPGTGSEPGDTASPGPNRDPLEDPRVNGPDDLSGGLPPDPVGGSRWPGYALVGLLLAVVLFATPALRRAMLRHTRLVQAARPVVSGVSEDGSDIVVGSGPVAAKARHDAHAAWDELIDTLIDYRLPVDSAETPRTTAERLVREAELRDAAAKGARLLGQAEERARYARTPLLTTELPQSLRQVRRAIKHRAPRMVVLRAILLPPSVLLRWQSAMVSAVNTASTAVGEWREAALRALSPRRLLHPRTR